MLVRILTLLEGEEQSGWNSSNSDPLAELDWSQLQELGAEETLFDVPEDSSEARHQLSIIMRTQP